MRLHTILIALLLLPIPSRAEDTVDLSLAQELHQRDCLACHQPTIYQDPDRTVQTLPQLHSQVLSCSVESNAEWFDEESDAVTIWLNLNYYLFGIK